jgi:hypothetical protein
MLIKILCKDFVSIIILFFVRVTKVYPLYTTFLFDFNMNL